MWKSFAVVVFALFSQLALALPTPGDIETAVRAGHFNQAESMLREVIQDKPQSAKAYYELGQVFVYEGRNRDAHQALQHAQQLDPLLKFARNPAHFSALLRESDGQMLTSRASQIQTTAARQSGIPWTYIIIGGAVMLALGWMFSRRATQPASSGMIVPAGSAGPASGNAPVAPTIPPGGSGIGGAVLGGLAGMAAGYGLAKVLEHENGPQTITPVSSPVLSEPLPQPDSDVNNFDAGIGDGWDTSDTGSGDDGW